MDEQNQTNVSSLSQLVRSIGALLVLSFLCSAPVTAGGPVNTRGVFFNNVAHIVQEPSLPIHIDGLGLIAGHPWYEARISLVSGASDNLSPGIEVTSSIAPANFLRPPGRLIPSPYDDATFRFTSLDPVTFFYASQWPQLFTPRDGRNTVVLTLVNRGQSALFQANFDFDYSVDQKVMTEPKGVQTANIQITPRIENQTIILRVRSEATREIDAQFVAGTADPSPGSQTPTSVIWTISNPAVGKALAFTVQEVVHNFVSPARVRYAPGVVVTSSVSGSTVGTDVGDSVTFPKASLPEGIGSVRYSLSRAANWTFDQADRTLLDIREVTELLP